MGEDPVACVCLTNHKQTLDPHTSSSPPELGEHMCSMSCLSYLCFQRWCCVATGSVTSCQYWSPHCQIHGLLSLGKVGN